MQKTICCIITNNVQAKFHAGTMWKPEIGHLYSVKKLVGYLILNTKMHRVQFGWCLRLCLMVMLLSVCLLIAALITTGSAYGRGSGLFSLSSSSDSSSTKMLALDQKGNRRRQNKSVLDSQTMERALQSKSMAVLLAVNKRHVQQTLKKKQSKKHKS